MSNVKRIPQATPFVMSGTGQDVIALLHKSPNQRTVAVSFTDDEQVAAAESVFQRVAEFLPQLIEQRQADTLQKFVSIFLTDVAPSKAAREQARMMIDAKTDILNSGDFLPASAVAKLAGFSATNPSVQPNKWKRNRDIFAIPHGREDYFPLYALSPDDHRPRKQLAEILRIFGDAKDGWSLAFWFASLNSFLDDERPQDVLAVDPDRVIAAAKDEVAGVQHG
jgi:hypothetical protein